MSISAEDLQGFRKRFDAITDNIERVIQGKRDVIELMTICLISGGHALVEDVPGVGKTLLAKSLARSIDCTFSRIQFTPDLLPSDVTGVSEAMEEHQVTVDGVTRPLTKPFLVMATQNPIEHEGTYPLPEAQLDRFMMRLAVGYPSREKELQMLDTHGDHSTYEELEPVVHADDVSTMVDTARRIHVADVMKGYLVDLADASRNDPDLLLGISPRATLYLLRAARTHAAASGRDYVSPDDVKAMLAPVLNHRLILRPEAQMRGVDMDAVITGLSQSVPVPGTKPQG